MLRPLPHPAPRDRSSRCKIVRQCVERMPEGDYRIQDRKVTPPPRARIDESMEALIHHFKLFTEGFKVPAGRDVRRGRVAPRRDRLLPRVGRDRASPYRMHIRGAVLLQPAVAVADDRGRPRGRRRSPSSRASTRSWGTWTGDGVQPTTTCSRRGRSSPGTRRQRSAIMPLLHLAQDHDGWRHRRRHATRSPSSSGSRRPRCSARAPSTRCSSASRVRQLLVSVCTYVSCLVNGGARAARAPARRATPTTPTSRSKRSSASPPATAPRCMQVNYEFHENADAGVGRSQIVEDYKAGRARRPRGVVRRRAVGT